MAKKENVDEYGTHKKNEQRSAELYSENQRRSLKSQSCSLGYARWDADACEFHSHLQAWPLDLNDKPRPTTLHWARPSEDPGGKDSIRGQCAYEYSRQDQSRTRLSVAALLQSNQSMLAPALHFHKRIPVATQGLDEVTYRQCSKSLIHLVPEMECCILHMCYFRKQLHDRQTGEEQCDHSLQKPGCMTLLPLAVECCIFGHHSIHKQPHSRHFGEAQYDLNLQKSECMKLPHLKVECDIVHVHYFHKQQHGHHFEEALCRARLQKPGCMTFRHSRVERCIVDSHWTRKQQHYRHCGEKPCEVPLQKPECMTFQHPEGECRIVLRYFFRKLQHCHHFWEEQYASNLQKLECMTFQHPEGERRIARHYYLHKPQHCHHFWEALHEWSLQRLGCMRIRHPEPGRRSHTSHTPQHSHHFGEELCEKSLQKPWQQNGQQIVHHREQHISNLKLFVIATSNCTLESRKPTLRRAEDMERPPNNKNQSKFFSGTTLCWLNIIRWSLRRAYVQLLI